MATFKAVLSLGRKRILRLDPQTTLYVGLVGVAIYLIAAPLGLAVFASFKACLGKLPLEAGVPFTLNNYVKVYANPLTLRLFINSLTFAAGSVLIAIPLSWFFAWLVERTNIPGRNLIFILMTTPMVIPPMLFAMSWVLLLSPRVGMLNVTMRGIFGLSGEGPLNIYTLYGMCFLEGMRLVPSLFLLLLAVFRNMDPALEEAARVSGANTMGTLRRITLPLAAPATIAALIYAFISPLEAFEIPLVIGVNAGIPVFTTQVYLSINPLGGGMPDFGIASTFGMLVVTIGIGLMYLYLRVTRKAEKFATITGKGYRPARINLGGWRYVAFAIVLFYIFVSVVLPIFTLVWCSLLPFYQVPSVEALSHLTFAAYKRIVEDAGNAIINTLILSLATATGVMVFVTLVSWVVVRGRMAGREILNMVTFMPHTIPSIVFGLAFLLMYLRFPIPLYGTIWIMVLALTARYMALPSRMMIAAQLQIHKELEEAGMVCGASWLKILRRIVFPLVTPAFINGWLWVAIIALRELAICLMLFSPRSVVISTIILTRWDRGAVDETSALGVMLIAALIILVFLGRRFILTRMTSSRRDGGYRVI